MLSNNFFSYKILYFRSEEENNMRIMELDATDMTFCC